MSFLKNLQSKSSITKVHYALGIASITTGIIAIFWISTVPSRFAEVHTEGNVGEANTHGLAELLNEAGTQLGNALDTTKGKEQTLDDTSGAHNLDALSIDEQQVQGSAGMDVLPDDTPVSPEIVTPTKNLAPEYEVIQDWAVNNANTTSPKTEEKKKVLIEVTKETPKIILIATTTNYSPE